VRVKIRKGDTVEVISGRMEDKGKRGEVVKVLPDEQRVVVQGVNIRKRHQRQSQTQGGGRTVSGGIVEFEAPVSIANVMLVCPKCRKAARVSIHREGEDSQRECKKCHSLFD
jgi:large subunit ribosomal protein L24